MACWTCLFKQISIFRDSIMKNIIGNDRNKKKRAVLTIEESLQKARNYCVYQERSQQEVRDKLYDIGLHKKEVEQVIAQLITENFINEERFATAFAGGKFRIKQWGRLKIKMALEQKKISPYCIRQALNQISDQDYLKMIRKLISYQENKIADKNIKKKKYRIASHLTGRGFEPDLVWQELNFNTD